MCQIMEDLIADEKVELALQNLQEGNVTESQVEKIFKLTPEQTTKVLELFHNKVAVQA